MREVNLEMEDDSAVISTTRSMVYSAVERKNCREVDCVVSLAICDMVNWEVRSAVGAVVEQGVRNAIRGGSDA